MLELFIKYNLDFYISSVEFCSYKLSSLSFGLILTEDPIFSPEFQANI